ncbi:paraquat-inducible protein B [Roseovarius sp. A-2]|uniref:MlaD family protein n=1 Tax=Roseovarius sp. A-2 TaxID=1570360 RepID=UPI0009B59587|nr:MlaD family protein [Roseovarius sp. A-2]GAW35688.1 paraquat-inducible protein B [Roseovarius sp. A-2]
MSDETTSPPEAPVSAARRPVWQRLSIVWIVPLLALVVVLAIAWQNYADRGPLIEIGFENASGVRAGSTELRYRDVKVGLVEEVGFADGLGQVLVRVRLDQGVAPYVDSDARFWVVRPQVTTQGVSGLDTVLSGVFIEGLWDTEPGPAATRFEGLADAPLERLGDPGMRLTLRAAGGAALTENAPILYRGIEVGRVGKPVISADNTAEAEAVIYAPHDQLINSATRFWDASGFSFSFGPGGAAVDFSSLASLVSGGITFDTMLSGGAPTEPGARFTVFEEESEARASIFSGNEGETLTLSVIFDENITGLSTGAPVELNGLRIGEVEALNGMVDEARFGDSNVRLAVTLAIRPGRLGLDGENGTENALDFLRERVAEGLRARLATASILTGGLKVELVEMSNAPQAQITETEGTPPVLPATDSEISDVSATAEGVFERINSLPVEEVMAQAISLMQNANTLIASDDTRAVPGNVNALLTEAQALPARLDTTLAELETLIAQINEQALAARITDLLDEAAKAARSVGTATEGVPQLIDRLDAVAARAGAVELDVLAADLSALLTSADALIGQDDTRALPGQLNATLGELTLVLEELRAGGVVDNAVAALDSARSAADTFAEAGGDLPGLIAEARGVLARANTTLEGYQAQGGVGRDARAALREVEAAAKAVASLARAIERNPDSLIRGR